MGPPGGPLLGGNGGGPNASKMSGGSVNWSHETYHLGRHLEGASHLEGKAVRHLAEELEVGKVVDLDVL